jgi:hypothetical protein
LVLSITLLTELYLAIPNSLPISARMPHQIYGHVPWFISCRSSRYGKGLFCHITALTYDCPYPSDIRCQGSRFRDLKVAYVKGKQPFLLMTSYHAFGYLILNGLDI